MAKLKAVTKEPQKEKLDEVDRLRLQVSDEKRARLTAQLQVLAAQHAATNEALSNELKWHRILQEEICTKYGLSGKDDQVSIETGAITRKKKE